MFLQSIYSDNAKLQELAQLVDAVGSESTNSDAEDNPAENGKKHKKNKKQIPGWDKHNRKSKKLSNKPPSAKKSKSNDETPKFSQSRESRKRAGDQTDFAIEAPNDKDTDNKSTPGSAVATPEETDSKAGPSEDEDNDPGMVFNEYDATNTDPEDDSDDDDGLVMLDDNDAGNTGMIEDDTGSEDNYDEEDEEEDDYFNMNDDDSDDSDDLPEAMDSHSAMKQAFLSASDTVVCMENQEKRNQFRRTPWKTRMQQLEKKKGKKGKRRGFNGKDGGPMYRSPENDIHEIIKTEKKKKRDENRKRIVHIVKELITDNSNERKKDVVSTLRDVLSNGQKSNNMMKTGLSGNGGDGVQKEQSPDKDDIFGEDELHEIQLIANESIKHILPAQAARGNHPGNANPNPANAAGRGRSGAPHGPKPTLSSTTSVDRRKYGRQSGGGPPNTGHHGSPQFMAQGETQFASHGYFPATHSSNYPPPTHYGPYNQQQGGYYYRDNSGPNMNHGRKLENVDETVQSDGRSSNAHSMGHQIQLIDHHSHNSHLSHRRYVIHKKTDFVEISVR